MTALSAREAKYNFGRMTELARAEPVAEEYERLTGNKVAPSRLQGED